MGFYSFLLFLELVDRLTSIVFRFLYLLVYVVIASYIFYAIEYGCSNLINNNLLYRPEKTLHFAYLYIKWWYAHRQQVGFRETFPLILAVCAPYLLYISAKYAFFATKNFLQHKICTVLKLPLPKKLQAKLQKRQKNSNQNQSDNEERNRNQPTDNSHPEQ